jgi:Flp pilus assembly pilin Flp
MAVALFRARRPLAFLRSSSRKAFVMKSLHGFVRKDDGQDLVEYALLASFISIVAVVTIRAIGPLVRALYENVQNNLT